MKIYWYCPPSVNKDFKDPLDNPSFRLRCYLTHQRLLRDGFDSKIVDRMELINNPDVVVLMSFGDNELHIAQTVTKWGASVIHDYCENIRGIPILEKTKALCKYIVCCSTWLAREESKNYGSKVLVVKDPWEPSPILHNFNFKRDRLKVVWAGMGGNAVYVESSLKRIIEDCEMDYIEISNRTQASVTWDKNWQLEMANCDIAICPQNHWDYPAKSNVKLTTALSLNLPVIVSPSESYLEVIKHGYNGYVAYSLEDWSTYLLKLKDRSLASSITFRAQESIQRYCVESIYHDWLAIFKKCGSK